MTHTASFPSRPTARQRGRIDALDALRGLAVLGMFLTHMSERFIAGPRYGEGLLPVPEDIWSRGIQGAVDLLLRGKSFTLFSLLFGVGFFLQLQSASRASARLACPPEVWILRRMAILFALGLIHHLFWPGDILTLYALGGLVLLGARHLSDRALLLPATLLLLGVPRMLWLAMGMPMGTDLLDQASYLAVLQGPSLREVFSANYLHGWTLKLNHQLGEAGRAYQTLGLFIIGFLATRRGWHERLLGQAGPQRRLVACGALAAAAAAGSLFYLEASGLANDMRALRRGLVDLLNLGSTAALLGLFLLGQQAWPSHVLMRTLATVGRASLTSYCLGTVLATFMLYGWGLGLMRRIDVFSAVVLGLALYALTAGLLTLWFRRFSQGPLEALWRRLAAPAEGLRRREG